MPASPPSPGATRHPSFPSYDEPRPPLPSRHSGALNMLIRGRSEQRHHHHYHQRTTSSGASSVASPPPAPEARHDLEAAMPSDSVSAAASRWAEDGSGVGRLLGDERRLSQVLMGPNLRSANLIGKSNPRYKWERYWKREDELKQMKKHIRKYYERTNDLIQQYMYIDCLLDSSIPHELLNEYSAELEASAFRPPGVPRTVPEEQHTSAAATTTTTSATSESGAQVPVSSAGDKSYGSTTMPPSGSGSGSSSSSSSDNGSPVPPKPKRTPKDIFRSSETMPLLQHHEPAAEPGMRRSGGSGSRRTSFSSTASAVDGPRPNLPWLEDGADVDSDHPVVTVAIWVNMVANTVLLAGKIVVIASVPSMSVLASLVDAVLDFLSTAIVWTTTRLISSSQHDQHRYPVGRRRLEPIGVLVFSIIMITAFAQVALQSIQRLAGTDHEILQLGIPAIGIMISTIVIKGAAWLWCRLVKNSSVQALADDAKTDVIFNTGSILFPIIGFYGRIWWLDALGGLLLSLVVMLNWSQTSAHHVRNLTGFSAQPDERNLLLYLTMRFATAIRQIQNLRAYHAGDKLFVEADIVLSANMPLKDSHDLSEVLTYFLESVPIVDRAFVHVDYASYNAPTHMLKQRST